MGVSIFLFGPVENEVITHRSGTVAGLNVILLVCLEEIYSPSDPMLSHYKRSDNSGEGQTPINTLITS